MQRKSRVGVCLLPHTSSRPPGVRHRNRGVVSFEIYTCLTVRGLAAYVPPAPPLEELLIEGLTTNVTIHQALLGNEAFLEGHMTTNVLDRVGAAAFLAAAARS